MSLINQNNNSQKDISFNNDTVKPTVDKKDEFIDNPILSQLSKRYKVKSTLLKEKAPQTRKAITIQQIPSIEPFAVLSKGNLNSNQNQSSTNSNNVNINTNKKVVTYLNLLGTKAFNNYLKNEFFNNKRKEFLTYGDQMCLNILKMGTITNFKIDDYIFSEVTHPKENHFFLILKGEVEKGINKHIVQPGLVGEYFQSKDILFARCSTDCVICEISNKKYQIIQDKFSSLEFSSEVNFLLSIDLFKKCNRVMLEKMLSLIEKKTYIKGDYITEQNQEVKGIYIIRKGQVEITMKHKKSISREFDMNALDSITKCPNEPFSSNRLYELKNSYSETKRFKIMILNIGDMINDFEIAKKKSNSIFSCKCNCDGTVIYYISKEKISTAFNENLLSELEKGCKEKENLFTERINFINNEENNMLYKTNKFNRIVLHKINHSPVMNIPKIEKKKSSHNVEMRSLVISPSAQSIKNESSNYLNYYERELANSIRNLKSNSTKEIKELLNKSKSVTNISAFNTNYNSGMVTRREHSEHKKICLRKIKENKPKVNGWLRLLNKKEEQKIKRIKDITSFNHNAISKCFEINKLFYIKNNTSILEKKLGEIFMTNQKPNILA